MPKEYENKNGIISGLKRLDLFMDTDKDGILDRDDYDIDGDGIPNDCDLAPFDRNIGSEDSDQDGIPDFCDLTRNGEENSTPLQLLQRDAFEEYGLLLNLNERFEKDFSPEEFKKTLKVISGRADLPSTHLMTFTLTSGLPRGEYGLYDQDWKNIRVKPDSSPHEEFPEISISSWTLVHELFHFVAAANEKLYNKFLESYRNEQERGTLDYPTKYAESGEDEYFAEVMTFEYFFDK